ncbi:hypothetical protein [Arthrobacter sp. TMS1-12-1]
MTEASEEHHGRHEGPAGAMEQSSASTTSGRSAGSAVASTESRPVGRSQALAGPFTLREVLFGGGVVLVFVGTLLPFIDGVVRYQNFWNTAPLFFIGIGILLPVVALALVAGRRLGSSGLRVGSLSVDQFASVSAVLATIYFFLQTVTMFHVGPLVALIGALAMLASTVLAPVLPVLKDDFADRPEVPAHPAARAITAARPRPAKPAEPAPAATDASALDAPAKDTAGWASRFGRKDKSGVNPAAAPVLQNGAGLYGAGGAGVVGAGPAASGQSGLERGAATVGHASATSDHGSDHGSAHGSAHSSAGASQGGAHAVDGHDGGTRGTDEDSSTTAPSSAGETRVHEVVRDEPTRADATDPSEQRSRQEPITATRSADEEPVVEAFWFAVGSSRPVFDEQTDQEVFMLQPGDWEVGIEDRGHEFLVQDKRTGAVGILRDLRNIERAPQD